METAISASGALNCVNKDVVLQASSNTNGGRLDLEWYDSNNVLLSDSTHLIVSEGGDYSLVVTENDRGCSTMQTINVAEDLSPPFGRYCCTGAFAVGLPGFNDLA